MTTLELKDLIPSAAGILLSLLFSYIPGLSDWYATLDKTRKQLVMLAALLSVTGGTFGLVCAKLIVVAVLACTTQGAVEVIRVFIIARIANQTTYRLTPQRQFKLFKG